MLMLYDLKWQALVWQEFSIVRRLYRLLEWKCARPCTADVACQCSGLQQMTICLQSLS